MSEWLLLVSNLPGRNQALRMRLWRGLKAAGAAPLRDGVHLLPNSEHAGHEFAMRAAEIQGAHGSARILAFDADSPVQEAQFRELFDRSAEYGELIGRVVLLRRKLAKTGEVVAIRDLERLQREMAVISVGDFFPGASRQQAESALTDARAAIAAQFSSGEPQVARRKLLKRNPEDFRGRIWITREHLWIDRVCSAWLIRRFIDPKARFLWAKQVKRRPRNTVGFDFDGAEFSHVGAKVTFEVLMHAFGLDHDPGLIGLAALVHYLDIGGVPVAEAAGLAAIVGGARALRRSDDELLETLSPSLDNLYAAFSAEKGK